MRLEDLAEEPWIIGSSSATCPDARILIRACRGCGFDPRVAFHSTTTRRSRASSPPASGVSLIPELALVTVRSDLAVRSVGARPPYRKIVAATLEDGWESPAKGAMLAILQEVGQAFAGRRGDLRLVS